MTLQATIVGIHPIEADEPVHLIELLVRGEVEDFDIGDVTQEAVGQKRSNWQAVYDERLLEQSNGIARYAFFFHYLDFSLPLLTPAGPLPVAVPTSLPVHLQDIECESP